jgi:hypothetical protein
MRRDAREHERQCCFTFQRAARVLVTLLEHPRGEQTVHVERPVVSTVAERTDSRGAGKVQRPPDDVHDATFVRNYVAH